MVNTIDTKYSRKPLVTPVPIIPPKDESMDEQETETGYKPRKPEGKNLKGGNLLDCLV